MVARTKAFDTNEILHKAMNVFGNLGYEGTSLPDLITGLGIARQSIYDTYGTKWELFFAAVRHYMDQKNQELKQHCEGPGTVVEKVELAFTTIIKVLMDPELRLQCFIISSAIEQAPHHEEPGCLFARECRAVGTDLLHHAGTRGGRGGNRPGGEYSRPSSVPGA